MAHDDRDRMFEKALARHLRSSAPLAASADISTSSLACPDPEILAAYHEQSLSPSELTIWKAHVVACTHCQFVLAQLAATEEIPLEPAVVKDPLLVVETFARRQTRSTESRSVEPERRSPSWRWALLIPAGAFAAVLVAWVAIRTPKPGTVTEQPLTEVAENREPLPAPSSAQPPELLTSPATPAHAAPKADAQVQRGAKEKEAEKDKATGQSVGGAIASVPQARDSSVERIQIPAESSQRAQLQSPPRMDHGPALSAQKQLQQQLQPRVQATENSPRTKALDQKKSSVSSAARISQPVPLPPAAPPPPPPSQDGFVAENYALKTPPPASKPADGVAAGAAPSASASADAAKTQVPNTSAPSSVSETVEVSAEPLNSSSNRASARAMLRAASVQNPHVFWAPGEKYAWRLGSAGSIEHSNDHGEKWAAQISGVTADLLSASAPSPKICWAVGSSGTILLTTDSGAHWTKLNSPVSADITVVSASDASHANILYTDPETSRPVGYRTADGGATWTLLPGN